VVGGIRITLGIRPIQKLNGAGGMYVRARPITYVPTRRPMQLVTGQVSVQRDH